MNNKIGVVILSRFSSSRLPGKALLEIKGKPVLMYIVERVREVYSDENIVIATSIEESDNPISNFAIDQGLKIYRGSLENVSERFYLAAKKEGWDYAIRINGDNIFVDIPLLKEMNEISKNKKFYFLSNVKNRTFPKGMSIEIVKLSYYKSLLNYLDTNKSYREHVMQHIYGLKDQSRHKYFFNKDVKGAEGIQLAIDTKKDFERSKYLISNFNKEHQKYNLLEIVKMLKNEKL